MEYFVIPRWVLEKASNEPRPEQRPRVYMLEYMPGQSQKEIVERLLSKSVGCHIPNAPEGKQIHHITVRFTPHHMVVHVHHHTSSSLGGTPGKANNSRTPFHPKQPALDSNITYQGNADDETEGEQHEVDGDGVFVECLVEEIVEAALAEIKQA